MKAIPETFEYSKLHKYRQHTPTHKHKHGKKFQNVLYNYKRKNKKQEKVYTSTSMQKHLKSRKCRAHKNFARLTRHFPHATSTFIFEQLLMWVNFREKNIFCSTFFSLRHFKQRKLKDVVIRVL